MLNGKVTVIYLIIGLMHQVYNKSVLIFSQNYTVCTINVKVDLDFPNYKKTRHIRSSRVSSISIFKKS